MSFWQTIRLFAMEDYLDMHMRKTQIIRCKMEYALFRLLY